MPSLVSSIARSALTACVVLATALPGRAQDAPEDIGATLDAVLIRLQSEQFEERERACDELDALLLAAATAQPRVFDRVLEDAIVERAKDQSLPLEARLRLIGALRERFMRSPRAAIGIQFANNQSPMGVMVGRTIEGFPVHEAGLLEPGDYIVGIDGISLDSRQLRPGGLGAQEFVRATILSHAPGESVRLTILRPTLPPNGQAQVAQENILEIDGQRLEILAPLGQYGALPGVGTAPESFEIPWRVRLERLGLGDLSGQTLTPQLNASDWQRMRSRPRPAMSVLTVAAMEQPGEFEDTGLRAQTSMRLAQGAPAGVQVKNGRFIVPEQNVGLLIRNGDGAEELLQTIDQLRAAVMTLDLQLQRFDKALAEGKLDDASRARLQRRIEEIRQQREQYKIQQTSMETMLTKLRGE